MNPAESTTDPERDGKSQILQHPSLANDDATANPTDTPDIHEKIEIDIQISIQRSEVQR